MRCHYENDAEIGRWFLPGCMGGAVYGPHGCTCSRPNRKESQDRIEKLEARVTELERRAFITSADQKD